MLRSIHGVKEGGEEEKEREVHSEKLRCPELKQPGAHSATCTKRDATAARKRGVQPQRRGSTEDGIGRFSERERRRRRRRKRGKTGWAAARPVGDEEAAH